MSDASDYMTTALDSLDVQMGNLQTRLTAEAQELQDAIDALDLSQADTAALNAAAARVQATAVLVSGLAQPSAVADPEQPEVGADPVPPADEPAPTEPTPDEPAPVEPTPAEPAPEQPTV